MDAQSWILGRGYARNTAAGGGAIKGDAGKSAYEIWLEAGNTGTQAQFLASLKGEDGRQGVDGVKGDKGEKGDKGDKGDTGEQGIQGNPGIQGEQGVPGEKGEKGDTGERGIQGIQGEKGEKGERGDPFLIAKRYDALADFDRSDFQKAGQLFLTLDTHNVYIVTETAYDPIPITSLAEAQSIKGDKGEKGDTGEQGVPGEKGEKGDTGERGIQGIQGIQGDKGEQGIQGEKGDTGNDGKSAYQVWLDAGHTGTEEDFIEFLKGAKGDKGDTNTLQLGEPQNVTFPFTAPSDGILNVKGTDETLTCIYITATNGQSLIQHAQGNQWATISMATKKGVTYSQHANMRTSYGYVAIFTPFLATTGEPVEQTYDPTSVEPISGAGVAAALGTKTKNGWTYIEFGKWILCHTTANHPGSGSTTKVINLPFTAKQIRIGYVGVSTIPFSITDTPNGFIESTTQVKILNLNQTATANTYNIMCFYERA